MTTPEMNITVTHDGYAPILTSLTQFMADNADGFESEEASQMVVTLERGETYVGGGGAAPAS